MTPEATLDAAIAAGKRGCVVTCANDAEARAFQLALYRARRNAQRALDTRIAAALECGESPPRLTTGWEELTVRRRGSELWVLPAQHAYKVRRKTHGRNSN